MSLRCRRRQHHYPPRIKCVVAFSAIEGVVPAQAVDAVGGVGAVQVVIDDGSHRMYWPSHNSHTVVEVAVSSPSVPSMSKPPPAVGGAKNRAIVEFKAADAELLNTSLRSKFAMWISSPLPKSSFKEPSQAESGWR